MDWVTLLSVIGAFGIFFATNLWDIWKDQDDNVHFLAQRRLRIEARMAEQIDQRNRSMGERTATPYPPDPPELSIREIIDRDHPELAAEFRANPLGSSMGITAWYRDNPIPASSPPPVHQIPVFDPDSNRKVRI